MSSGQKSTTEAWRQQEESAQRDLERFPGTTYGRAIRRMGVKRAADRGAVITAIGLLQSIDQRRWSDNDVKFLLNEAETALEALWQRISELTRD